VGQNVHAALQGDFDSLARRDVGKDRLPFAVGGRDDRGGSVHWHDEDAIRLDGLGEDFDAVCAGAKLLLHAVGSLGVGFDFGDADLIGFEKIFDVDRSSALYPERLADGENSGAFHFAGGDTTPNENCVFQDGRDVKDGGETPAREHFLQLRGELFGRKLFRVKKAQRKDMNVAVPKAGGNDETFAIDLGGVRREFEGAGWSNSNDVAVMDEDRAVFDRLFRRGDINFCADQHEIGGLSRPAREEEAEQESGQSEAEFHIVTIRGRRREWSRLTANAAGGLRGA